MHRDGYVKLEEKDYIDIENNLVGRLDRFTENHKQTYLYGAGDIGKRMYVFLHRHGLSDRITGFLVSGDADSDTTLFDLPVRSILSIKPGISFCVILSLAEQYHKDVAELLNQKGINDLLSFSTAEYDYMYRFNHRLSDSEYEHYLKLYPPAKYSGQEVYNWRNILLIAADAIGDEVINIPFIRNLRQNCHPGTMITAVVRSSVASFMEKCPYIDRLIVCNLTDLSGQTTKDCEERAKDFAEKYLQDCCYDVVFLHGWFDVRIEYFFLTIFSNAPIRIGYSEKNNSRKAYFNKHFDSFLSVAAKSTFVMNEVERDACLLEFVGGRVLSLHQEFWTDSKDIENVEEILQTCGLQRKKLIALVPHALANDRMWDKKFFLQLMKRIIASYKEICFIMLGGKDAVELGAFLCENLPAEVAVNLAGETSVCEAAEILKRCCMYIGCNTGLAHVAAAVKTPTVAINCHAEEGDPLEYSSTQRYKSWGNESYVVCPQKALPGCGATCYAGEAHCINQVEVDEVFAVVNQILKRDNIQ